MADEMVKPPFQKIIAAKICENGDQSLISHSTFPFFHFSVNSYSVRYSPPKLSLASKQKKWLFTPPKCTQEYFVSLIMEVIGSY